MNPFVSMIIAFKDYSFPYAKNIFWAFCTFYGLTFAIGFESTGSDINAYIRDLHSLYSQNKLTIEQAFENYRNSGEIDIFQSIISFVLSRFTDSQAVLTTVYAFIFGYFFSRNIWYIFGLLEGKLSILVKTVLFALILVVPIWNINGIRMYLAFHVFMFGLLPYIFENRKNKLLFVFASFLIHFSFSLPIIIFLIYRLLGNHLRLYFFIFIISIFTSEFEIGQLNQAIDSFVPQALIDRSAGYTNETVVMEYREHIVNTNIIWYLKWFQKGLKWSIIILLIYFMLFADKRIKLILEWKKLLSLSMLYFAVANILSYLPSGGRFYIFSFFLSLVMVILYLNQFKKDRKLVLLTKILTPAFILFIIVSLRLGLYSTSVTTVFGNPIIAVFNAGETTPLNNLIK